MTALAEPIHANPDGSKPPPETVGDLLKRLGGISPDRVTVSAGHSDGGGYGRD